jgi:uncharacterized membrane protein YedE/YeeE
MLQATLGGLLIGGSAVALLALNGRIAGVSGILGGILAPQRGDLAWRACFVAGLIVGGVCVATLFADPFSGIRATPYGGIAVAGLLVGFGASLGNGRSIVATITFMMAGAATVFVVRHVLGGWPA